MFPEDIADIIYHSLYFDDIDTQTRFLFTFCWIGPHLYVRESTGLVRSVGYHYNELVQIFLDDPTVDIHTDFAFASSIIRGNTSIVQLFLDDSRIDPSIDNDYPIILSYSHISYNVFKLLLYDERVNPHAQGDKILYMAAQRNHDDPIVRSLLTSMSHKSFKSLIDIVNHYVTNNNVEMVQYIINHCPVPHSSYCINALLKAFFWRRNIMAKMILTQSSVSSWPPRLIIQACTKNLPEIVDLMINTCGMDPTIDDNECLKQAVHNSYTEIIRILIKQPTVDVLVSQNGAMRWAAQNGHKDIVEYLLKDPRVSPLDIDHETFRRALFCDQLEIYHMLRNHMTLVDKK